MRLGTCIFLVLNGSLQGGRRRPSPFSYWCAPCGRKNLFEWLVFSAAVLAGFSWTCSLLERVTGGRPNTRPTRWKSGPRCVRCLGRLRAWAWGSTRATESGVPGSSPCV